MIILVIPAIVGGVAVALAAKKIKKTIDHEKEIRIQIRENADRDIEASRIAGAVVRDRIKRGEYDGNFQQVLVDYEFLRMTHNEE